MQPVKSSNTKFIPPHLRKQQVPAATGALPLSRHAIERSVQRKISEHEIAAAIKNGVKIQSPESIKYITEAITVVTAIEGKIITVIHNSENQQHDITHGLSDKEQELLKGVAENNTSNMCDLAQLYLSGDLGFKDVQKAITLLLKASDERNSHAMVLLAELFEDGVVGGIPDPQQALIWWRRGAQAKNKYALYFMAQYLLKEYVSSKDQIDEIARENLQKQIKYHLDIAVNKGGNNAIWLKGWILEQGYFGEVKLEKAVDCYSTAAKAGHVQSLRSLHRLSMDGAVTEDKFEVILEAACKIISIKSSESAVEIGLQQIDGELGKNPQRGFKMLEDSAALNNIHAIQLLAECYRDGRGCNIDIAKSKFWSDKAEKFLIHASSNGNIRARWDLGCAYLRGDLGGIRLEDAEAAFIDVAKTNQPRFMLILGTRYIQGTLGDKDPAIGKQWISKALEIWTERANTGDLQATENLIDIYLNKEFGLKNYEMATHWLQIYATKVKDVAPFRTGRILGDIYSNPKRSMYNLTKAVDWYEKADAHQNSKASFRLGCLHLDGSLGRVNIDMALKYFNNAIKEDFPIVIILAKIESLKLIDNVFDSLKRTLTDSWHKKLVENKLARQNENSLVPKLVDELERAREATKNNSNVVPENIENSNVLEQSSQAEELSEAETKYLDGIEAKNIDVQLAALKFRESARQGYVKSNVELADLFASGKLGQMVKPVAMLFYKRAAKKGDIDAMKKLITHHRDGELTTVNPAKAEKWSAKLAAKLN